MSDPYQFYDAPYTPQPYQYEDRNQNDDYTGELPDFINDAIDRVNAILPSWPHWNSTYTIHDNTAIEYEENNNITNQSFEALYIPTNTLNQDIPIQNTNNHSGYNIFIVCSSTFILHVLNTESNNINTVLRFLFN